MIARRHTWLKYSIVANVLAIGLLFCYMVSLGTPSTELARMRNALLLDERPAAELEWTPLDVPAGFKAERLQASPMFREAVTSLAVDGRSDWDKAIVLADHLTRDARDLGPIRRDLHTTYREIVHGGRGYCADFTRVYLALAHAAGVFAREWSFSFDGYGGHGHAVIEIFDRRTSRWAMLDVYNNIHFVSAESGRPLSAAEVRSRLAAGDDGFELRRNGGGRLGYTSADKLIKYYREGLAQWYLWGGNAVFSYDAHALVSMASAAGRGAERLAAMVAGVHPRIYVARDAANRLLLDRMQYLRWTLVGVLILVTALAMALVVQALWLRRSYGEALQRRPCDAVLVEPYPGSYREAKR